MESNHHPDEERLAAFAGGEPDVELRLHVRACEQCRSIVDELTMLRAALAALPDLAPSRPLQLLPEVPAPELSGAERLAGWTRRAFMPLLAAGFGLAIVGSVGTAGSIFTLGSAGAAPAPAFAPATTEFGASSAPRDAVGGATASPSPNANTDSAGVAPGGSKSATLAPAAAGASASASPAAARAESASPSAAAERVNALEQAPQSTPRSLWPMVLFAGVALIVATLLVRWIVQPRAG